VIGGVPLQAPVLAVSVWPSVAVPVIAGRAVFEGATAATTAVAWEVLAA